ncbi:hypothetical protein SAMN05216174_118103 [Actinokineospora iranica]|uniref:Uncharacterized protein n=1 Tax=Actinokineospora iranica TaxID=1271860 RepID=A0A1G6XSK0_9PSEU|nr:hypothetical protein SAMN05216174_118103 [Actinokineospora iranica]
MSPEIHRGPMPVLLRGRPIPAPGRQQRRSRCHEPAVLRAQVLYRWWSAVRSADRSRVDRGRVSRRAAGGHTGVRTGAQADGIDLGQPGRQVRDQRAGADRRQRQQDRVYPHRLPRHHQSRTPQVAPGHPLALRDPVHRRTRAHSPRGSGVVQAERVARVGDRPGATQPRDVVPLHRLTALLLRRRRDPPTARALATGQIQARVQGGRRLFPGRTAAPEPRAVRAPGGKVARLGVEDPHSTTASSP